MGGKGGGASNVMQQDYGQYGSPTNTGGWTEVSKPVAPPKAEEPKKPAGELTEDPSKAGAEQIKPDAETHPFAPPGWGNYPTTNTNLTGLGDELVAGMQAQPGKAGPVTPNYVGQV